ncbi:MAG: ATP-binding protein [Deltaproteobacteria bacterium]
MKEIVVLSGKGGVGKSSITAAVGDILSRRYTVLLADTDVDAPNLHLVLGAKPESFENVTASEKARIDYNKCQRCMVCASSCRFAAIIGKEKPVVAFYACEGCGACAITCPEEAIEIRQTPNGRVNTFHSEQLPVVGGEIYIGESNSGRLVDLVRRTARRKAADIQADFILTDGPPGIGCPVIASIKGASYVVVVTEPSPAALHDMARLLEVIGFFKVPTGLVLNKAEQQPRFEKKIKVFAADQALPVLAEVPYDITMPMAVSMAKPVTTAYPDSQAALAIRTLADRLAEIITAKHGGQPVP